MKITNVSNKEDGGLQINTALYENISVNFENLSPIENTNRKSINEISNEANKSESEDTGYNRFLLNPKQKQVLTEVPERSLESERTHDFSTMRSPQSNNVDLMKETRTNSSKHIFLKITDNFNTKNLTNKAIHINNSNEFLRKNNSKRPEKYIPSQINDKDCLLKKKEEPIKMINNELLKSQSLNQFPKVKEDISTKQLHWQVGKLKQLEKEWNSDKNPNSLQIQTNSENIGIAKSNFLRYSAIVLPKNQYDNNTLAKIESNLLQIHKNKLLENERMSISIKDQSLKEPSSQTYISISRNPSKSRKEIINYISNREKTLKKDEIDSYLNWKQNNFPSNKKVTKIIYDNDGNILNTTGSRETRTSRLSSIRPVPSDPNYTVHKLRGTNNSNFRLSNNLTSGKSKVERFSATDRLFCTSSSNPDIKIKNWTDFTVYDRNNLWLNSKQQKMNTLQNSKAKEELNECTFKPYIPSKNSNNIIWSPTSVTPNSTKDYKSNYSIKSGSANSAKSHSRTGSLSQERKKNTSYSKFFEIKRNLHTYKNLNLSKTFNSFRRIESPKHVIEKENDAKLTNISYTERILNKETIKIAEMLNNLKKTK